MKTNKPKKLNSSAQEAKSSHLKTINREMLIGWLIIVAVLTVTYIIEVAKHDRTLTYLLIFIPVITLPLAAAFIIYLKKPDWKGLCYVIVPGYFIMYLFVMITGSTAMVFSYILPMLSLLILYHHPNLILCTGIAALILNLISITLIHYDINYFSSQVDVSVKDSEIQVALIILCFGGCYFASRLYDRISKQNYDYIATLNEKNEHIRSMSLQTITTIANMLDAKDPYTEGHSQRVAEYSRTLALGLGMGDVEADNIRKIALMYDIGKIGVPDNILNKAERLNPDEYELMKLHATVGSEIVKDVSTLPGIYDGVRHHHENYDGSGYPDGLKGEDIPYIARVIAVTDSFDAMTTDRVYRRHLSSKQAIEELKKGKGTQFDPAITDKMIEMLASGEMKNISPDIAEGEED